VNVSTNDRNPPRRAAWRTCLVALLLLGSAGCGDVRYYVSRPIELDAIESRLRMKESTRKDVLEVLGPPEGKGREMLPISPAGIPWKDDPGFNWDVVNYAPLTVGGALLFFGGWWVLSAKHWFKGPVRMGTDEELEQLEETQLGSFDLPTEEPA